MSHNYYEDYKNEYKYYLESAQDKPNLSEIAQHGMAYCGAVLRVSSNVRGAMGSINYSFMQWTEPIALPYLVHKFKAAMTRHDWAQAIAITNNAHMYELSDMFKSLRVEYDSMYCSSDLVNEIYSAIVDVDNVVASDGSKKGGAISIVRAALPVVNKYPELMNVVDAVLNDTIQLLTLEKVNRSKSSDEYAAKTLAAAGLPIPDMSQPVRIEEIKLSHYNPFLTTIARAVIAETAMTVKAAGVGRIQTGRRAEETLFSNDTAIKVVVSNGQLQKYPMYRRLRRAGSTYIANFDMYLTSITDMCRLVERVMTYDEEMNIENIANNTVISRAMKLSD